MPSTPDAADAAVVCVANGKGGAGKTSVAVHLAGMATGAGWRTLLVDLDPQGNCGHDLGYGWTDTAGQVRTDHGAHLVDVLVAGASLVPPLRDVRPGLDVVPGGLRLDDVEDVVVGRLRRAQVTHSLLRDALAPLSGGYDLVVIDTPPTRPTLLQLALAASRWIVVPTRSDRSSIEGLRTLAAQVGLVRPHNPSLEVLGAVLFGVTSSASVVRRNAEADIVSALAGAAPLLDGFIRYAEAAATEAREQGLLVHEVAARAVDLEPFWAALREGRTPERVPGSAAGLAADYLQVTRQVLATIARTGTSTGTSGSRGGGEPTGAQVAVVGAGVWDGASGENYREEVPHG